MGRRRDADRDKPVVRKQRAGEKYYDWFVRELRRRAAQGAEAT